VNKPREITLTIPALPPSKNEYDGAHWSKKYDMQRVWQSLVFGAAVEAGVIVTRTGRGPCVPTIRGPVVVEIEFHFPDRRRRDTLNYAAFPPLMDSLTPPNYHGIRHNKQGLGLIEDDSADVCEVRILPPIVDGTRQTVIRIARRC
jgi:hypothetical protein